jgi:metal-responsive CopG/Arc/MetJ family transcriptional regulator
MSVDLDSLRVPKLKTSVALSKDVLHEAHQVARKHGVSLSEYITRLLQADLDERKKEGKD